MEGCYLHLKWGFSSQLAYSRESFFYSREELFADMFRDIAPRRFQILVGCQSVATTTGDEV